MSPIALLWIALLQLLAPAGSMRPAPHHMDARIVLARQTGEPCARAPRSRAEAGVGCDDGGRDAASPHIAERLRGLDPQPLARSTAALRRAPTTTTAGTAPARALHGAVVHDGRTPIEGAADTAVDRTSRDVVASGRLVVNLPIPPPVG